MGDAARRKAEIAALKSRDAEWLAGLSPDENIIATVAQKTYDKLVGERGVKEACYNLAFFLFEHLRRKYSIEVKIVVGWVNDGLWEGATSHAWVEYAGKKIDISLTKTSHPDEQPSGDLIILDHIVKRGKVSYQYWPTIPEKAEKVLKEMGASSPEVNNIIMKKEREHLRILNLSKTPEGVAEYFRSAPKDMTYDALARIVG